MINTEVEKPIDIHEYYQVYNVLYFDGILDFVSLEWSKRMKLCAGLFEYKDSSLKIKLSEPLLKFRSNDEIRETLLHEMIHAYLFIKKLDDGSRDGHGIYFLNKMNEINKDTGLNITVYHSFHDEVDHYRVHIWRCDGKCKDLPPYFGYVKRSMNRKPSKSDYWWKEHQKTCGGEFTKISGPSQKTFVDKKTIKPKANKKTNKNILDFFESNRKTST